MSAGLRSRIWRASARLHPAALPAPIYARWQVLRSFSGVKTDSGKADEAAGPAPGNEDNAASVWFSPEKPCFPLLTEDSYYCVTVTQKSEIEEDLSVYRRRGTRGRRKIFDAPWDACRYQAPSESTKPPARPEALTMYARIRNLRPGCWSGPPESGSGPFGRSWSWSGPFPYRCP